MLLKKIVSMRNKEDCSMDSYLKEIKDTLDQLESIDFSIPHELIVIMILNYFSTHYNIFVKTLASKDSLPMLEELELWLFNESFKSSWMSTKKHQLLYWQFKVGCRSSNFKFQAQTPRTWYLQENKDNQKINKEIRQTLTTKIQNITTNHGLFY